ncbi:hypothetical protein MUY27_10595 [Mucilaginibacter sp. RS28]|uniref:Uncharacterized protein n=1 Tax=Mucilaginibacter straminoryzae TaxID=2932774 RepID=A0A9X1X2Y7_9SPHI|nr:hypothetical protein [Mucilaginibacter straminoryzae]MCJ8210159.1 hypothetical protein [Mucilaginibacter straminoryzae]
MKKILIGFFSAIYAITAQAQVLEPVKVDNLVTVSLPKEFSKKDTLGQTIYSGNASLGYVVVIKSPNPPEKTLKKEKDLKKVFKEYTDKVVQSSGNGTVLNSKDTVVNNVEVRDFTLATTGEQGNQMRRFRVLYTKPATYTFQYTYPEEREALASKEMKEFLASIKTAPDFDGKDQYATFGQSQGMNTAVKIILIGVGALLIVLVVWLVKRNSNKMAV